MNLNYRHNKSLRLGDLLTLSSEALKPKELMNVWQAAEKYRWMKTPSGSKVLWDTKTTPYLKEPMEEMTNRLYRSVVFCGPAQCGKTELFTNYLHYTIRCDPADISLVQTIQNTARDFSLTRVDRFHDMNPDIAARVLVNNTFDKQYRNGMILRLSWPTVNELSGKPIPRIFLTDVDRMTMDVDGEGPPYVLADARITSFKKFGKMVAESSPGFDITDPAWVKRTPHEAPPTQGILYLYNQGDRRRWYWKCIAKECGLAFEPSYALISFPKTADAVEAGEMAVLHCPYCGQIYTHEHSKHSPSKYEMNQLADEGGHARWVKEGQVWQRDGAVVGDARRSNSASFWLKGVAATFSTWKDLVTSMVTAEQGYEDTGFEETLKATTNTKLGEPYLPKAQAKARVADTLMGRKRDFGERIVPFGVRFLVATIDIQRNRFEVQIHGVGLDDVWVIDRFPIRFSKRRDKDEKGNEHATQLQSISPGGHKEDWRHIVYEVMEKTYPLQGDPTRVMGIYQTFSDSAGSEGFTTNAYDFVRWLRNGYRAAKGMTPESEKIQKDYPWKPGFEARFKLVKGEPTPSAPSLREGFPDAQKKDKFSAARGDVAVNFINSTIMKNHLDTVLERTEPGGRVNFPDWLGLDFFKQLVVETRNREGRWENLTGHANESWDLLVYLYAGLLHRDIAWAHIDWNNPPPFAAEWDKNSMVFKPGETVSPFIESKDVFEDLAALGKSMNRG